MRKFVLILAALMVLSLAFAFTPYDKYQYFYSAVATVRMLENGDLDGVGSGVVIAPGRLLTAAHLFAYGTDGWTVNDGDTRREFVVTYMDPEADVAVLAVRGLACPCASLAQFAPGQFDELFALGYPLGTREPVLTTGRWQARSTEYLDLTTVPVTFGNSGGPVFIIEDGMAKVAGMVISMKMQPVQIGFRQTGVPVNHLSQMAPVAPLRQAILCADGASTEGGCAPGVTGDTLQ